jgi:hypothetical protein
VIRLFRLGGPILGVAAIVCVGGMPVNMPAHGHVQGYADLNFLIPELVERARYRKGPYHASIGDFSSAGGVDFDLVGVSHAVCRACPKLKTKN